MGLILHSSTKHAFPLILIHFHLNKMDYNKLMEYLLNLKYIFKLRKKQKTEINWTKPN